jgi:spore coat protein H
VTLTFRQLAVGVAAGLMAVSCGGDGTSRVPLDTSPEPSEPSPSELSEVLFDQTVVHEIAMEISDEDLDLLDPPTDDRVPVVLTVDGQTADGAGVRLKQGFAQFRGLDDKPGFSIETDEFVDGLDLFDVDRFTLGNAVWDHSFVAEQLVYELYRAAGIPSARTALARVTVNGETFGLYVMRETYDERWLAQYFEDPTGNLYEKPGGPPDTLLELRTNKRRNDTSDLAAVVEVVATASDEDYRDAIEELVDVDELLTYWAIEALTAHWDGYVYDITTPGRVPPPARPAGNPWPNNFYAYHDPDTDRFVFIPHGADLAFGLGAGTSYDVDPSTPVLVPPKESSTIAVRLWDDPAFRDELAERIRWVLDEVWDVQALTERTDLLADLVRADGLTGSRESVTTAQFEDALADRKDFLTRRPEAVRAELAAWESGDGQGEGG